MKKEEIEENVNMYQDYISQLQSIENRVVEILDFYKEKHADLMKASDFRPGTFGRLLSSILTSKFFFHSTFQYIKQNQWDSDYKKNILPKKYPDPNYLGHFIDIDMGIRFYLFHSVYHQIETTYRILHKSLKLESGKPIEVVTKKLNLYDGELIKFFDAIRNTIHNNGFYMPLAKNLEKEFSIKFNGKDFSFKENDQIAITTKDFIAVALAEIELVYKVLQKEEVLALAPTRDMTH